MKPSEAMQVMRAALSRSILENQHRADLAKRHLDEIERAWNGNAPTEQCASILNKFGYCVVPRETMERAAEMIRWQVCELDFETDAEAAKARAILTALEESLKAAEKQ